MYTFIKKHKFVFLFTCIYACIIIFVSPFHEVWRDEVRALNYATEARSIPELFKNLHNEGHPALWHLILYVGYNIFHTKVILKIFNIIICIFAIFIFLLKSPFSKLQKALFIFGYFPLYGYSIINRSYGLAMLLLFIICALYKKRFEKILLYSVTLFLFVNIHVLTLIIGYGFFLSILVEYIASFFQKIHGKNIQHTKTLVGLTIIILGMGISFLQAYPDARATFSQISHLDTSTLIQRNEQAFLMPGFSSASAFGTVSGIFVVLIFWIFNIYLFSKKPFLFIIFFISNYLIELQFIAFYEGNIWNHSMVFIIFVISLWLDKEIEEHKWLRDLRSGIFFNKLNIFFKQYVSDFIFILFMILASLLLHPISQDIFREFSSSKRLAADIKSHDESRGAILMGEPDHFMESLAYYLDNPIYIPREKRFGKTVKWTTNNQQDLTLDELLLIIKDVRIKYKKPIFLIFSYDLNIYGPFYRETAYNRTFSYNSDSIKNLLQQARLFGRYKKAFGFGSSENYYAYIIE